MMEHPYSLKPYETDVRFQLAEKSGTEVGSVDAAVAHSPTDSDMDMEDDITHPDEEKGNCLSINSNDENVSKSEEDDAKEQLQPSQHATGLMLPVLKAEIGGSEIASYHATRKVASETDDSGMSENGQNEHPLDVGHKNFRKSSVPESGDGKLSGQAMEGANSFKLLQGYASDNTSKNDEENIPTNFDAEKGVFGSELRHETLREPNSKSKVESPGNVMQTDKVIHTVEVVSDKGEETVTIRDVSPQTKDSRNYDDSAGLESANLHKADARSNSSKLNVDEFGRLVREGVSDSDTSDSPSYARRHARRTRKRSRSRSQSPHDRRRRRSPRRRKERRSRSRSLSPKRRRSRSRTPVMRRDSEFGGDKLRREKGPIPECFDFLRGKCYRGATCRYSHHESDKRYNRDKQHYRDEDSKVLPDKEMKYIDSLTDISVPRDAKNTEKLPDDSTTSSPSKFGSLGSDYPAHILPLGKDKCVILESAVQYSTEFDGKQVPSSHLSSPITKPFSAEEVTSQELLPSIPMPSALQAVSAQPITQDYNSWNHMIPQNFNPPYQAPAAYQHSHFQGLSMPLSSSFVLPPPPPPPATGEHSISSLHMQQSKLSALNSLSSYTSMRPHPSESHFQSHTGQYQPNSDQMLHTTDKFGSSGLHVSNLMTQQSGPHRVVEDRFSGHPVQGMNPSLAQAQTNTLPLKGTHSSVVGGPPMGNISDYRPYFQHASYGPQHSSAGLVPASHAELGMVSSCASRIAPEFLETNPPYARDFLESRTSNYHNTYASNFDLPRSSKFSTNVLIQENHAAISTKYGAPVDDAHKIGMVGSESIRVLPRPGGDQYDPLFDYIETASNSFSKADHRKRETTGDSEEVVGFCGSGRVLNIEGMKQEGVSATSAKDSLENEECGETGDIEVDAVLNGTPSNPNDATDMNAGDIEIDQIKTSGKKKKSKERSMKHFKISIATFVKEVLKPSWRQGNMSKEAFKTIVKKTVDKVSGAMKSHEIPKSQAKINHYIESSRGKLTKLVMGYVDKYVKV